MENQILQIMPPYSVIAIRLVAVDETFALFHGRNGDLAALCFLLVDLPVQVSDLSDQFCSNI
jgi:hypothetical protein